MNVKISTHYNKTQGKLRQNGGFLRQSVVDTGFS